MIRRWLLERSISVSSNKRCRVRRLDSEIGGDLCRRINEITRISVFSCVVAAGELTLAIFPGEREEKLVFEELVAAHQSLVLRTAYRLLGRIEDAQDAAQEVFLRLFRNMRRIDSDPKAWLYRVTVNVCRDQHRRRKQVHELDVNLADPGLGPERMLALDQRKQLLMEGLQTLPERERAAVVLRDIEGLSTAETAAILGVEEVTVRSQISTARVKLAKYVRRRK
jgi:RNA polymerase sigma-70 factor (ECF subfamily)